MNIKSHHLQTLRFSLPRFWARSFWWKDYREPKIGEWITTKIVWTGKYPYLRLIHPLVDHDNIKSALLHRHDIALLALWIHIRIPSIAPTQFSKPTPLALLKSSATFCGMCWSDGYSIKKSSRELMASTTYQTLSNTEEWEIPYLAMRSYEGACQSNSCWNDVIVDKWWLVLTCLLLFLFLDVPLFRRGKWTRIQKSFSLLLMLFFMFLNFATSLCSCYPQYGLFQGSCLFVCRVVCRRNHKVFLYARRKYNGPRQL